MLDVALITTTGVLGMDGPIAKVKSVADALVVWEES
jgi:hypothetical protein